MRYRIIHKTAYEYASPVGVSYHIVRQHPRTLPHQQVLESLFQACPQPASISTHVDCFGNESRYVSVEGQHREFVFSTTSVVDLESKPAVNPNITSPWQTPATPLGPGFPPEVQPFLFSSPIITLREEIADYAAPSFTIGQPLLAAALDLMARVHRDFKYKPGTTTISTPVLEVLQNRQGVCQDFAHLTISCLRCMGVPARYVSGYLETIPPPGKPKLVGADASHAWLQVWTGAPGWVDLDPTNNVVPGTQHITVAYGRDFSDVSPLRGVLVGGGRHVLKVAVDVMPLP